MRRSNGEKRVDPILKNISLLGSEDLCLIPVKDRKHLGCPPQVAGCTGVHRS